MRLVATLLVLLVVLWLGSRALTGSLQTAAGTAPASGAGGGNAAQRAADRIGGAVVEGAARRASEAEAR